MTKEERINQKINKIKEKRINQRIKKDNKRLEAIQKELQDLADEKKCLNLKGAEKELYKIGYEKVARDAFQLRDEVTKEEIQVRGQVDMFDILAPTGLTNGGCHPEPSIFINDCEGAVRIGATTIVAMYHLLKERGLVK